MKPIITAAQARQKMTGAQIHMNEEWIDKFFSYAEQRIIGECNQIRDEVIIKASSLPEEELKVCLSSAYIANHIKSIFERIGYKVELTPSKRSKGYNSMTINWSEEKKADPNLTKEEIPLPPVNPIIPPVKKSKDKEDSKLDMSFTSSRADDAVVPNYPITAHGPLFKKEVTPADLKLKV